MAYAARVFRSDTLPNQLKPHLIVEMPGYMIGTIYRKRELPGSHG